MIQIVSLVAVPEASDEMPPWRGFEPTSFWGFVFRRTLKKNQKLHMAGIWTNQLLPSTVTYRNTNVKFVTEDPYFEVMIFVGLWKYQKLHMAEIWTNQILPSVVIYRNPIKGINNVKDITDTPSCSSQKEELQSRITFDRLPCYVFWLLANRNS